MQGISFRGHRDDATATDSANCVYILVKFRAQTDDVLRNFIECAPKSGTYTSKTIQNNLYVI